VSLKDFTPGFVLAWTAVVSLALSLLPTIVGLVLQLPTSTKELEEIAKLLLSWPVIAGGLAGLGARTFETEIKEVLRRLPRKRGTADDVATWNRAGS